MVRLGMTPAARSRWVIAFALGVAVIGCLGLLTVRVKYMRTGQFSFLSFNLFLACIPFLLAWLIDTWSRGSRPIFAMVPVLVVWLLFFPNAPYLMTDLVHLREAGNKTPIYDAVLFASFAATGIMLGYSSLYLVQSAVSRRFSRNAGWGFSFLAMALGSYGLYLGRVQRWNSWDVLTRPGRLFREVASHLLDPLRDFKAAVVTVLFAVVLVSGYVALQAFARMVAADDRERRDALRSESGEARSG